MVIIGTLDINLLIKFANGKNELDDEKTLEVIFKTAKITNIKG